MNDTTKILLNIIPNALVIVGFVWLISGFIKVFEKETMDERNICMKKGAFGIFCLIISSVLKTLIENNWRITNDKNGIFKIAGSTVWFFIVIAFLILFAIILFNIENIADFFSVYIFRKTQSIHKCPVCSRLSRYSYGQEICKCGENIEKNSICVLARYKLFHGWEEEFDTDKLLEEYSNLHKGD